MLLGVSLTVHLVSGGEERREGTGVVEALEGSGEGGEEVHDHDHDHEGAVASVDEENPGLKYIDPVVAIIAIAIMILTRYTKKKMHKGQSDLTIFFFFVCSRTIARESCLILLQTMPAHLDVGELKEELFSKFPNSVLNIHEMHIWCLVPGNVVVTMHVIFQSKQVCLEIRAKN